MPTIEAFGPGKTLEQHNQEMVDYYTQMIEADPEHAENYRLRAKYYDYLNKKEETLADIGRYEAVLASSEGTSAQDRWMRDLLIDLLHSVPENPGPPLNSSLGKTGGSLSTDGLSLFFSSRRPEGHGGNDLWISRRDTMEDNWGDAANLGSVVNSRYTDSEPSISSDGLSLYFRSHRPDGFESGDLWVSTRSSLSSPWSAPTNLGPKVNSPTYDSWPCISADGLMLFFESTRPGGYGHYDIWVTTREALGNEWSSPVNLGPIVNSTDLDGHPHILPDNLTLFFQSNRPGQYGWLDLWVTTRETTDSPWSKPMNLGPAVNSRYGDAGPGLTPDGSTLVFGSNRPGGYGGWDTWQVSIGASGSSKGDSNLSSLEATGDDGREEVVPRNDQ
jgi:Tol biopolymer transport system component